MSKYPIVAIMKEYAQWYIDENGNPIERMESFESSDLSNYECLGCGAEFDMWEQAKRMSVRHDRARNPQTD